MVLPSRAVSEILLAVGLVPVLDSQAVAKPRATGFRRVVERAEVIAVARLTSLHEYRGVGWNRFLKGEYQRGQRPWSRRDQVFSSRGDRSVVLELTRIIKGNIRPGKYRVFYQDEPSIDTYDDFVAFLGKGLYWQFAAQPLEGNLLGNGVLQVAGFCDDNAYWVWPGLVTLAQIEQFVRQAKLAYTFRGPLFFPQRGSGEWRASTLHIEATYDAVTGRAEVRGLPELRGFPPCPQFTSKPMALSARSRSPGPPTAMRSW
jgi:hypothetical protein